jgi:Fic family protein
MLDKTRLYGRMEGKLNKRQEKVIGRMLAHGLDGFEGGMNASKYMKMTGAPDRTATRDLQKLVELGVLVKTGERKGTRYWIR